MSDYKYPYIPKEYYPAVMGACKYIRETGYFSKAVSYYANKYDLDERELEKHIRKRQAAGQKASTNHRKYGYVALEYSLGNERNGGAYFEKLCAKYTVKRATSIENAQEALSKYDDYASEYAPCHWFGRGEIFPTEKQAQDKISEWRKSADMRGESDGN